MKNSAKKHKNTSCWAKGELTATGSVSSKAKVALISAQMQESEGSGDPKVMNSASSREGTACHCGAVPQAPTIARGAVEPLPE